jgi:hypothetical protein
MTLKYYFPIIHTTYLTHQLFIGQVIGTPVGTTVFVRYGWRAQAALSMGLYVLGLVVLLVRGPGCGKDKWVGWEGECGVKPKKRDGTVSEESGKEEGKDKVDGKNEEKNTASEGNSGLIESSEEDKGKGSV